MSFAYSFFDESGKFKDHSVVSFGGIAGGSQTHNALAEQWKALLRRYGLPSLTMKQALNYRVRVSDRLPEQTSAERAEALMPFVACIKEHAEIAVLNTMDVKAFNSMPAKAKQGLGGIKNPHYVSFLMDIQLLCRFLAEEDTINIIC